MTIRRLVSIIAVATVLGAGIISNAQATTRGPAVTWRNHRGGIVSDVKALIRRVEHRWHTPGGLSEAESVARCESGFHPNEDYGQYSGVYQIGDTEWRTWKRPHHYRAWFHGLPGPHNARANVITALFHAKHGGWGPWSCR